MSKIDLYDPKWIDLVFQDKNKEYGAYQLRKGTSKRNLLALAILMAAAIIVGGYLIYKIEADKRAAERQAYMEQLELSKLQEQAEKEKKKEEKKIEKPKFEPKKEIPQVRETQKFTAPVIKKDELVKEDNQMKQMDQMRKELKKGDKVMTTAGIIGTITSMEDNIITVRTGSTTLIDFEKSAILRIMNATTAEAKTEEKK